MSRDYRLGAATIGTLPVMWVERKRRETIGGEGGRGRGRKERKGKRREGQGREGSEERQRKDR